jgi:hypothetical protein
MPTKHPIKQRAGLWRVWYTIEINGDKQRRSKSVKSIQEADTLMLRLAAVEQATRTGVATLAKIFTHSRVKITSDIEVNIDSKSIYLLSIGYVCCDAYIRADIIPKP